MNSLLILKLDCYSCHPNVPQPLVYKEDSDDVESSRYDVIIIPDEDRMKDVSFGKEFLEASFRKNGDSNKADKRNIYVFHHSEFLNNYSAYIYNGNFFIRYLEVGFMREIKGDAENVSKSEIDSSIIRSSNKLMKIIENIGMSSFSISKL